MSKRRKAVQLEVVPNNNDYKSYQKRKKPIQLVPKSLNPETYIYLLEKEQRLIVFESGPDCTGPTTLTVLAAVKAVWSKLCGFFFC